MKFKIYAIVSAVVLLLSLLFISQKDSLSQLLDEKTIEALTDDEWRKAKVPQSKTEVITVNDKSSFTVGHFIELCVLCYSVDGTLGAVAAVMESSVPLIETPAGAFIEIGCGIAGICLAAIDLAQATVQFCKGEQIVCCGNGAGNCYPLAPDKSDIRKCKSQGAKVGVY